MRAAKARRPDCKKFIIETVFFRSFIKFKQLKEFKAGTFARDNNNIKALKGPITLFGDNYTKKIVNIVKNSKVY